MGSVEIGQKFGRLTVIERAPSRNGRGFWLCQCECGNTKEIRTDALKDGKTQSCGCLHREVLYNKNKKDLLGQTFGKLTVIEETPERDPYTRAIMWKCRCECGNEILVPTRHLTTYHTQSCGCMKSQGEFNIGKILSENNFSFEKEKTFESCRFKDTNALAKFDFYVNNQYIIEFDGRQHFQSDGSGWYTEEVYLKTVEHDKIKNDWCRENNIPIIRIPYNHINKLCLEDLIPETSQFLLR